MFNRAWVSCRSVALARCVRIGRPLRAAVGLVDRCCHLFRNQACAWLPSISSLVARYTSRAGFQSFLRGFPALLPDRCGSFTRWLFLLLRRWSAWMLPSGGLRASVQNGVLVHGNCRSAAEDYIHFGRTWHLCWITASVRSRITRAAVRGMVSRYACCVCPGPCAAYGVLTRVRDKDGGLRPGGNITVNPRPFKHLSALLKPGCILARHADSCSCGRRRTPLF